jgi:hypothetical protein
MRLVVILLATVAATLGIVWLGTRVLASPTNKPSAAQAAAAARVDRNYRLLVRRLRIRARRVRDIKAARGAWARRANRICGRTSRALAAAARPLRTARSKAALDAFMSNVEAIQARSLQELRDLQPPWHDRARVQKLLALGAQEQSLLHAIFAAIRSNDRSAFVRLVRQGLRVRQREDAIASALGADACAQGPLSSDLG